MTKLSLICLTSLIFINQLNAETGTEYETQMQSYGEESVGTLYYVSVDTEEDISSALASAVHEARMFSDENWAKSKELAKLSFKSGEDEQKAVTQVFSALLEGVNSIKDFPEGITKLKTSLSELNQRQHYLLTHGTRGESDRALEICTAIQRIELGRRTAILDFLNRLPKKPKTAIATLKADIAILKHLLGGPGTRGEGWQEEAEKLGLNKWKLFPDLTR